MSISTQIQPVGVSNAGYRTMKATSARLKGALVYIDYEATGPVDLSLSDNTEVSWVAVAAQDIASGDYGLYQDEGEVTLTVPSGNYTAGNGLKILDGAIADTGAAFPAAGLAGEAQTVFGVIKVGGTSVTSITAVLHGKAFTATT